MKCKTRLTTSGDRVVSSRDPDHNHTGNVSIARARKAVEEMKNKITYLTATPSSSQAAVMSELPDDTLMALPRRATVSKALRRHRKKVTDAANGDIPLPEEVSKSQRSSPENCQYLGSVRGAALFTCHHTLISHVEHCMNFYSEYQP